MKRLTLTLCVVFATTFILCVTSQAADINSIRIAIITDRDSSLGQLPLISFLETKLSAKAGVQLLERGQIDKILDEQKMSLSGLLDRNSIIKVGQILRADAFLMLSAEDTQDTGQLIRIRFVDSNKGLRLIDTFEEINPSQEEAAADRIIKKINESIPKIQLTADKAVLVGIIGIHRVQLGEQYQWLERVLPAMLSSGLGKEPRIIVLEREDLKVLQDEKLLTPGSDSKFFSSTVLINGYLQRRDSKGLVLRISIRHGYTETEEIELPIEPNEPKLAVDTATEMIIKQVLNASPSVSWQPKEEADEFLYEGSLLTRHKRFKEALSPLETAHALVPKDFHYTWGVFLNEWNARAETKGFYSDLELAELVSLFVQQAKIAYENKGFTRQDILYTYGGPLTSNIFYAPTSGYFSQFISASTEEIAHINRQSRKIWFEMVSIEAEVFINLSSIPSQYLNVAWLSSDIPEEVIDNLRKVDNDFLMPPELGGKLTAEIQRLQWAEEHFVIPRIVYFFDLNAVKKSHLGRNAEKFLKLYEDYLIELTQKNAPYVKFYAYVTLARLNKMSSEKHDLYTQKAFDTLFKDMNSPNEPFDSRWLQRSRRMVREKLSSIVANEGRNPEKRNEIFKKIYSPLIEQADINNLMIWVPDRWLGAVVSDKNFATVPQLYGILKGVEKVYENSGSSSADLSLALNRIKEISNKVEQKYPQLLSETQYTKLSTVEMILKKTDWPNLSKKLIYLNTYTVILPDGDTLWVGFLHWNPAASRLKLAQINLKDKKVIHLWQTEFPSLAESPLELTHLYGPIKGIAVTDEQCFVAITNLGLVKFSRNVSQTYTAYDKPQIISEKDGLPSTSLTGLAGINKKLWIAYGDEGKESGLVIFEPETRKIETVFCSTVKGETPFERAKPYKIINLTPGTGNKLFFNVDVRTALSTSGNNLPIVRQIVGLWKVDTVSHKTEFLNQKGMWPYDISVQDKELWLLGDKSIVKFDPNSEVATAILGRSPATIKVPILQINEEKFVPDWNMNLPCDFETATIFQDKLWTRLGNGRRKV